MHDPFCELQSILLEADSACLERFAARALGSLLGVPVRVARSGDQRGGDGGTSSIGSRDIVFEARRYGHKTKLDERSILGEIDQATNRSPDLEAWILVTTRIVPEQIQDTMVRKGLELGIGTLIIDWLQQPLPKLAVLAASCPECFQAEIGHGHELILEQIAAMPSYAPTLESIKSELKSWLIGYEAVRKASHAWLEGIWKSRRKATARFRQDVAGGEAEAHHVRRSDLIDHLDAWLEASAVDEIGALVGPEGVGKTWLAIDWLQSRLVRLPIIVLAPSSTIGNGITSRTDLIRFIARYLHDISGVRNEPFWERRVRRLLERPAAEGPAFIIFFDGLNQVASFDWLGVFKQLQDNLFYQRALTLISVRTSFYEEGLDGLRAPGTQSARIDVGNYDMVPGGAFDQKLKMVGLSREELSDELIRHAVVPRLFDLVVQLKDSLGGVSAVTVNRLLWAYGASTISVSTDGAFSESTWRNFILQLAQEHRDAHRNSTIQRIKELSEDATLEPDRIHQRVSGVIDGIFTELSGDGELRFHEDFVYHALGLALVKRMEQIGSDEDATAVLEQFLDPIANYDARAETLCAAINISLDRSSPQQPRWLSTLCTFWIQTQNLPDEHIKELEVLAPELLTPLLDVIESSGSHVLSTPRYIAVNALSKVKKSDGLVARKIAERGARWHRFISLENHGSDTDQGENSPYGHRCKRLKERIGTAEAGEVTVAGRVFEIVEYRGDDLIIAAAQLLQGRPLADTTEFFLTGAIHQAIVGGGTEHESQSWLNVLNTVDPEKTAERLRNAAEMVRDRTPEPGVHGYLNKRIASLLLWRTGYAEDAEKAWKTDPKIDHWFSYETDYLDNPSRSFYFQLERRHTAQALRDIGLPIIRRIERAKDALLDPSFEIPPEFIDELISTGEGFDFSQTATGRNRTRHDLDWERLSLALARCAPGKLAELERKRLLGFSDRPENQRFGASLVVPGAMLLVRKNESAALYTLRKRGSSGQGSAEYTAKTNLLISEIQCKSPGAQVRRIMESGLEQIDLHLANACDPPSEREIGLLLDEYGDNQEKSRRLASILGAHNLTLSDRVFDIFFKLLKPGDADVASGAVWVVLAFNEPVRLGAILDNVDWAWSLERHVMENHMGSVAIAASASNRDAPFMEYAHRIAPAKLLKTLSQEERSREDVELAVELLTGVLFGDSIDPPEPGVAIFHEQEKVEIKGYECTIGGVLKEGDNRDDIVRFLEKFNSPEKHEKRRREIVEAYFREVKEARRSGAQLYRVHFTAENFEPVLKHCPHAVETWLEGLESSSSDFIRRVRLAEGFFVALCEALLREDPTRGIALWRVLREHLITGFIGRADIDRLVYALFTAQPCGDVNTVLEEIYCIDEARNDDDLMDLVIAARLSGRVDWLRQMLSRDAESSCPLHRQRATFLEPLLVRPDIAGDEDWPEGEAASVFDNIREESWKLAQREAFAAYWLRKFAEANTVETAHAYWRLFKACADRRAWIWMMSIYKSHTTRDELLEAVKQKFIKQEEHNLKNAIEENEKSWSNNFAWRRYPNTLRPWRSG
ncbi:MAG: hypothetical protein OXL41_15160 [Nitrospinae bacterium]|nr:hypothetical protein [Nitrospinota bacterium]